MADTLTLTVWLHPNLGVPFKFDAQKHIFQISGSKKVAELMDECEEVFEVASDEAGMPMVLQISVLWNTKNNKKALNPDDKLSKHFASGDTFGVYGDLQEYEEEEEPKAEEEKTPVTILTGFLGSGKTTLLNYILKEQRDKKIVVIENEFGEISIDDALLTKDKLSMAEKVIVMDNGCMCCTIRGDLVKGLTEILDDVRKGNRIDGIIIETTGMADPVPIIRTFMTEPDLHEDLRLDAVVAMADSKNLQGRLDDKVEEGKVNEAFQQIAFADKIILNKLDLVTTEEAIAIKDRIRNINKFAKVLPAVKGNIRLSEILNVRAHDIKHFPSAGFEVETSAEAPDLGHGGGHGGGLGHGDHPAEEHGGGHEGGGHEGGGHEGGGHGGGGHEGSDDGGPGPGHGGGHGVAHGRGHGAGHGQKPESSRHDSRVNSFAIVREGEFLPKRLAPWVKSLKDHPAERGTLYRVKAILAVKNYAFKHAVHAVMDVTDEDNAGPWGENEKRTCKIVFIGKGLDQAFLRERFEAAFAKRKRAGTE